MRIIVAFIFLVFSLSAVSQPPPSVANLKGKGSGVWAYTNTVQSVVAGGVNFRVGMTHDELVDAAKKGRLYIDSQNEARYPDGLRVIRRYTDGKVDFEVRIGRVYSDGPYQVTSIATLAEQKR